MYIFTYIFGIAWILDIQKFKNFQKADFLNRNLTVCCSDESQSILKESYKQQSENALEDL